MSDEVKVTEEKECNCFCKSEGFRNFLVISLGTFVGVYSALCLFVALHKPPCHVRGGFCNRAPIAAPMQYRHHKHHFDKGAREDRGEFQKPMMDQQGPAPFDASRGIKK